MYVNVTWETLLTDRGGPEPTPEPPVVEVRAVLRDLEITVERGAGVRYWTLVVSPGCPVPAGGRPSKGHGFPSNDLAESSAERALRDEVNVNAEYPAQVHQKAPLVEKASTRLEADYQIQVRM
jgi:hypothetical protein